MKHLLNMIAGQIACNGCKTSSTSLNLFTSFLLNGFTILWNKDNYFFVYSCPYCSHRNYIIVNRKQSAALSFDSSFRYNSFPYSVDLFKNGSSSLFHSYQFQNSTMEYLDYDLFLSLSNRDKFQLEDHFCTYLFGSAFTGPLMSIYWLDENEIDKIINIENQTSTICFPRYVIRDTLLEAFNGFCWSQSLQDIPNLHLHEYLNPSDSYFLKIITLQPNTFRDFSFPFLFRTLLASDNDFGSGNVSLPKSLEAVFNDFDLSCYDTNRIHALERIKRYCHDSSFPAQVTQIIGGFPDYYISLAKRKDFSWEHVWQARSEYVNIILQSLPIQFGTPITAPAPQIPSLKSAGSDKLDTTYAKHQNCRKIKDVPTLKVDKIDKKILKSDGKTVAQRLVEIARQNTLIFKDQAGETFIAYRENEHIETYPLGDSEKEAPWLVRLYYEATGNPPSAQSIKDALNTLRSLSWPKEELFLRVAKRNNNIYIDLCNENWEQVEISSAGWNTIQNEASPVYFKRAPGSITLDYPDKSGDLNPLYELLNLKNEMERVLIVSWLLGALSPEGPYPILILQGEQGSAKSTTSRILKELVAPEHLSDRTFSSNERDFHIFANNSWVLNFDNISYLSQKDSDALCRMATGAGFGTRKLYTDAEETVFKAARPVILNGIPSLATRPDLASRSLVVTLPPINPSERITEKELYRTLKIVRPKILGALYNAISAALRNQSTTQVQQHSRLADFEQWICAAEEALPWGKGTFTIDCHA